MLCFDQFCNINIDYMLDKKVNITSTLKQKLAIPTINSAPKPDLILNLRQQLIPIHRSKFSDSHLISEMETDKKIILVDEHVNSSCLQKIIAYYYGHNIELQTIESLDKTFQVLSYLQIYNLPSIIEDLLVSQVKEYDVFVLLSISYRHHLQKLAKICLQYLQIQQFQQAQYQQYSLYETDFRLFQIIIRRHHILKSKKTITGLSVDIIQHLINNYCRRNFYSVEIKQKLLAKYVNVWKSSQNTYFKHILNSNNASQIKQRQPTIIMNVNQKTLKQESIKSSLKLQKLSVKGIGQSTTIYGMDSEKRLKQQFSHINLSPKMIGQKQKSRSRSRDSPDFQNIVSYPDQINSCSNNNPSSPTRSVRKRKFSVQIQQELQLLGFNTPKELKVRSRPNSNIISTVQTQYSPLPIPIAIEEEDYEKSSSKKQKDKEKEKDKAEQAGNNIISQKLKKLYNSPGGNSNTSIQNQISNFKQNLNINHQNKLNNNKECKSPTNYNQGNELKILGKLTCKRIQSQEQLLLDQIQLMETSNNIQHKTYELLLQESRTPQTKSLIFQQVQVIEEEMQQSADINRAQKKQLSGMARVVNINKNIGRQPRVRQQNLFGIQRQKRWEWQQQFKQRQKKYKEIQRQYRYQY